MSISNIEYTIYSSFVEYSESFHLCNMYCTCCLQWASFFLSLAIDYAQLLKKYNALISTLVSADMDFTQLDAFLSSQMKKRQVCLNCPYVCVL